MEHLGDPCRTDYGLEHHGLKNLGRIYWTLPTAQLYEHAIQRREGWLSKHGPLVVRTGRHTGRAARDKYIVEEPESQDAIWWGEINRPFPVEKFELLHQKMCAYLAGKDVFVQDCFAGADPHYRLPIRVITENAWHNHFARNMFLKARPEERQCHRPEFVVLQVPSFLADPEVDGTLSETFIVINFAQRMVLIGGTHYAGEIKKSVFSVLNYLLPPRNVLPMHSAANIGPDGHTALFFGLSGTGKTTLSADSRRTLIGDDEHGWSEHGVFNFEGGCYAKVIWLSREDEPEIYCTTETFSTILENVGFDEFTREVDLSDQSITENTRASYPIHQIPNATLHGRGGHPRNILFLTCDAFGILPPVAKLDRAQAMYYFISGYTAQVAGTEEGISEPKQIFSPCFGAPFLPLHPARYADLLGKKLQAHDTDVWLVNTGWTGGPCGLGERIPLKHTRAMVDAILDGKLAHIPTETDPVFGLARPLLCPGVPEHILDPRETWQDILEYDNKARALARRFNDNFSQYLDLVGDEVREAAPRVDA